MASLLSARHRHAYASLLPAPVVPHELCSPDFICFQILTGNDPNTFLLNSLCLPFNFCFLKVFCLGFLSILDYTSSKSAAGCLSRCHGLPHRPTNSELAARHHMEDCGRGRRWVGPRTSHVAQVHQHSILDGLYIFLQQPEIFSHDWPGQPGKTCLATYHLSLC